jgi:hypothetical protein
MSRFLRLDLQKGRSRRLRIAASPAQLSRNAAIQSPEIWRGIGAFVVCQTHSVKGYDAQETVSG